MYWINKDHENKFNEMIKVGYFGGNVFENPEYACVYYILSTPEVSKHFTVDVSFERNPFYWFSNDGSNFRLSSSSKYLVEGARNLWNSNGPFNLCDGLDTWDKSNYLVFVTAIALRYGVIRDRTMGVPAI